MEKIEMDKIEMEEVEMDEVKFELTLVENQKEEKGSKLKRKAIKVGEIAVDSVKRTVKSPLAHIAVGISALNEGLKEGNDYKDGIKSGMITAAWVAGLNATGSIIDKRDKIKDA